MKKLMITCSMIGACALVVCADTVSSEAKTTPVEWFEVTASATNGVARADNNDALFEFKNSKFEIDSDIDNPVIFTTTTDNTLTQDMARVTFTLDAAVVPNGTLPQFDGLPDAQKPKVAFAISEDTETTTNFMAWVGGQTWILLTGATVPAEGTEYVLKIEFDNRDNANNKVRFLVDETPLKADSTEWISYATALTETVTVKFVGCGKMTSFVGNQLIVTSEIIVIGDKGKVEIDTETKEAFTKAIENTGYETVDDFLADDAKTAFSKASFQEGLKVAEAYALGLVVKGSDDKMVAKDSGKLKVVADAQASTKDGIPVNLNIAPPTDSGATITYILQGSVTGASGSYDDIVSDTDKAKLVIPTDNIDGTKKSYRFFKVITNVKLKDAPDPSAL